MSRFRTHRTGVLAIAIAAITAIGLVACEPLPPAPPGGTAADCKDIAWGSGDKAAARMSRSEITGVRAAGHRCYDRMVIDLKGTWAPGWNVGYRNLEGPGSGEVIPLRGGASLEVVARAPAYTDEGVSTFHPANPLEVVDVSGFQTFRQIAYAGSFEAQSSFGIGVRARLPFRVFALEGAGGTRLVIDVAHHWA